MLFPTPPFPEATAIAPIQRVREAIIRQAKVGATVTEDPYWCDILPRAAYDGYLLETAGTFWDVLFWPTPSTVRALTYKYKLMLSALDGSTYVYPLGGPDFAQVILQACLAKAEQMKLHVVGPQTALAQAEMLAAIRRDALKGGSRGIGKMVDPSDQRVERRWSTTSSVSHPW